MDHHATPPGAATAAGTGRYPAGPLDALDAADAAFRLLAAGPQPLAVHASRWPRACRTGPSPSMSCGSCCCTPPPAPAPATGYGPGWSAAPGPATRPG